MVKQQVDYDYEDEQTQDTQQWTDELNGGLLLYPERHLTLLMLSHYFRECEHLRDGV